VIVATFAASAALVIILAQAHGWNRFWIPSDYMNTIAYGGIFIGLMGPLFVTLLLLVQSTPAVAALLETQPLRYFGRISYGLYLYHWPIIGLGDLVAHLHKLAAIDEQAQLTGLFASPITKFLVIVLVAIMSFELIERPLLRRRDQIVRRLARWTQFVPVGSA
jgi:peptidoglycan/LPS O-acetylase OafA/YrhL